MHIIYDDMDLKNFSAVKVNWKGRKAVWTKNKIKKYLKGVSSFSTGCAYDICFLLSSKGKPLKKILQKKNFKYSNERTD